MEVSGYSVEQSLFNFPGGRQGIGQDFDIFQKIAVKFPTPGAKM